MGECGAWDAAAMNLQNVVFETGTAGLLVSMVALQQANGIDLDTALARVRATLENETALIKPNTWDELVDMMRWFAAPPDTPPATPAGP